MSLIHLKRELEKINPAMLECPPGFRYETAAPQAQELRAVLEQNFQHSFDLELGIQNATFHAQLAIPPVLCTDSHVPQPAIRLSNFQKLAVITVEEKLITPTQQKMERIITGAGFRYIPFSVFGTSFTQRQRFTGDLFNQLFDYV